MTPIIKILKKWIDRKLKHILEIKSEKPKVDKIC